MVKHIPHMAKALGFCLSTLARSQGEHQRSRGLACTPCAFWHVISGQTFAGPSDLRLPELSEYHGDHKWGSALSSGKITTPKRARQGLCTPWVCLQGEPKAGGKVGPFLVLSYPSITAPRLIVLKRQPKKIWPWKQARIYILYMIIFKETYFYIQF